VFQFGEQPDPPGYLRPSGAILVALILTSPELTSTFCVSEIDRGNFREGVLTMAVGLVESLELIRRAWQRAGQRRRGGAQEENGAGELHLFQKECGGQKS
jgi:hypothetical protein